MRTLICLCGLLAIARPLIAQPFDFSGVTALAQGALEGQNVASPVPGFDLLLMKDGVVVYHRSFGFWSPDRVANADSATKTISGAVILSLVDSSPQPFSLDTKLSQYIPAFSGLKTNITIRQAFSHTSGLADSAAVGDSTITLQDAALQIASGAMLFLPGAKFNYGGTGMQAAGAVAELAGQKPWNTLFAERLKDKVGMPATTFVLSSPANPRIAGGCESNTTDFARFMEMLRRKGVALNGSRVLSESAVAAMFTRQTANPIPIVSTPIQISSTDGADYGVGVWLDKRDQSGKLIGAIAAGARGFAAWIDFDDGMVGVFATDLTRSSDIQNLYDLIRDAAQTAVRSPLCPGDLNYDGLVIDNDFTIFLTGYNIGDCTDPDMPGGCPADLNRDGTVDDWDFQVFASAYNRLLCP
ncbi:MAG: serine hydrolase [Phycisphaerales bacterium]|nr:serine hydrolase [Planctomycetota bacterium]